MGKARTVDEYIHQQEAWQQALLKPARALILRAAPGATESIKWAQPVFESNGPFCYLKAHARHVTFGFWRGQDLTSISERIEGDGTKMGHIKLRGEDDIDEARFQALIRRAVELNGTLGNPAKGR